MRIVRRGGKRRPEGPPPATRFEIRPNGELPKNFKQPRRPGGPKKRRGKEKRYAYVMMDHWNHRVVGYFVNKRLAEKELARRTGMR